MGSLDNHNKRSARVMRPVTTTVQSKLKAVLLGGAAVLLANDPAFAQGIGTLEEIIVTARKREERLLDTPVAVTALTAAVLEQQNPKNITGISQMVPNLVFDAGTGSTGGSANAQVFIRGIGQQDFLFTSDPGVGLYIDGVYYPRVTGIVMDMVDLEQIEVLRGPQGTLFGKNTIGGAINISTKKPGDEFGFMAQAIYGSRDRIDIQGSVNVPVVEDKFALRISGSSRNQDGFVKRITTGETQGDIDSLFGRVQARFTPDETLTIDLSADVTRKRETSIASELVEVAVEDPSNAALMLWNMLVAPLYGPDVQYDRRYISPEFRSQATGPDYSNFDMFGASLVIEKQFSPDFWVKSITSYRDQDAHFADDSDHSPLPITESRNDNYHKSFSQEIQFHGNAFDNRLKWVVGGFYMHEKGSDDFHVTLGKGLYDALESLPFPMIPMGPGVDCVVMPFMCAGGPGNPINVSLDLDALISNDIKIDSYAVFGEFNFDITDRLTATAGARYSYDKKKLVTSLYRKSADLVTLPETFLNRNWDSISPRFGLKYKINNDAMVYASVTGGFKSGGFNGRATSAAEITSFDPEKVWAYEVGAKFMALDHRLSMNIAAFYNDYSDMQLLSVRDVSGILVIVTENAGKVEIKGFEAEVLLNPVEGLNIRGSVGYLDSQYKKLAPTATVSLTDRLVKSPKWTTNIGASYTIPTPNDSSVTIGANYYYRSSYVNELTNLALLTQKGYGLVDAYLQYNAPNDLWSITLFGTNLSDERYMGNGLSSQGSFGTYIANFGAPREWGIKFRVSM